MVSFAAIEEDSGVDRPFEALALVGSLRISMWARRLGGGRGGGDDARSVQVRP